MNPFCITNCRNFCRIYKLYKWIREDRILYSAIGWSFFITILSVVAIVLFTSMTAYYITRVKSKFTSAIILFICIFYDSSIPNGYVSYGKVSRYFKFS